MVKVVLASTAGTKFATELNLPSLPSKTWLEDRQKEGWTSVHISLKGVENESQRPIHAGSSK